MHFVVFFPYSKETWTEHKQMPRQQLEAKQDISSNYLKDITKRGNKKR